MAIHQFSVGQYKVSLDQRLAGGIRVPNNLRIFGFQHPWFIKGGINFDGDSLAAGPLGSFKNDGFNIVTFSLTLPEREFLNFYAVLSTEKPVTFFYTSTVSFEGAQENVAVDITGVRLTTDLEAVGEGVDTTP